MDFCGGTPRRPFEGLTLSTFNKVNRPNQAYPIFIDPKSESLVGVGKSLQELIEEGTYEGEKENYVYDYSVAPEGTVAVWPITSKGKECVWRQIPSRVKSDWDKGYIKVIKNKVDGHPNSFSVQYLPEGLIKKINNGILEIIGREEGKPTLILGENETEGSSIPTIWTEKDFYTVKGTNALKEILPESDKKFNYPKAPELIYSVLQAISKENDVILDSFAGSGTTGQAVLALNNQDDGDRKFILIEMMDYADTITAERVKRVIKGYSYKGELQEEIYSKKLTLKSLAQGNDIIEQAEKTIDENKDKYDKISKPKISDNCLKVFGTKVYVEKKDGIGGAFDYYEIGEPLFQKDGNLNENVGIQKIREYIYYTETHEYLTRKQDADYPYMLDYLNGTGYFFYYKPNEITTLSHDTLNNIPKKADHYVIYADVCTISSEQLEQKNITFKKIPRDINRF